MSDEPVLRLLAPLTPMYVGRASPGDLRARWVEPARPQRIRHDNYEPCVVEAIVTVDAKGRVPWPTKDCWLAADVTIQVADVP